MMKPAVQSQLLALNRRFYDQFASSFSNTRGRVQPGVGKLAAAIPIPDGAFVLDVGCGNGTLARALARQGFSGRYLGLDLSDGLLEAAARALGSPSDGAFRFAQADLADPEWTAGLTHYAFDWVVSFAVFHHLPGLALRRRTAHDLAALVKPDGRAAVSVWQWQNSPRLRKRVLPWSRVGLSAEDLDEGDVLLDWRAADQVGLRYVHTFTEAELTSLAEAAGFEVLDCYYSDGKPGNLALYQVWKR